MITIINKNNINHNKIMLVKLFKNLNHNWMFRN